MKKPFKVLLVEDDPMVVRMYQQKLTLEGFEVALAMNGEDGLVALKENRPDIVLLDIMMPKLSGLDMLKTVKADEQYKNLPVVVLTNLGDRDEDVQNAKNLGAEDYWVKVNLRLDELTGKINKIISANVNK